MTRTNVQVVSLRVSAGEYYQLLARSHDTGLPVSSLLRMALEGILEPAKAKAPATANLTPEQRKRLSVIQRRRKTG